MATKKQKRSCKGDHKRLKVVEKKCVSKKNKYNTPITQKQLTNLVNRLKKQMTKTKSKSKSRGKSKGSKSKGSKRKNCPKGSRRVGRICRSTADLNFLKKKIEEGMSPKDARAALKEAKMKAVAAAMGVAAAAPAAKKVAAPKKSAGAAAKKGRAVDPYKGLEGEDKDKDRSALFVQRQGQKAMDNLRAWFNKKHRSSSPASTAAPAAKKVNPYEGLSDATKSGLQKYNDAINALKAKGYTHKQAVAEYKNQKEGRETQRGSPPKAKPAAAKPLAGKFPKFTGTRTIFE